MGFIECIFWSRAEKKFEGFGDGSWHGNVDILPVLILVNGQYTVVLSLKVHEDFIIFLKSAQDMISVSIRNVFDTKIIFLCCMPPEGGGFASDITTRSKGFYQVVVC